MKLSGLKIADVWSFCADCPCDITFDQSNTVIIGKNNSGKSNIFRGIRWVAGRVMHNAALEMSRSDVHDYAASVIKAKPLLSLTIELTANEYQEYKSVIREDPNGPNKESLQGQLSRTLSVRYEWEKNSQNGVQLKRNWSPFAEQQVDKMFEQKRRQQVPSLTEWLQHKVNNSITILSGWRSLSTHVERDKSIVKVLHEMQGADTNNPDHLHIFDRVESLFLKLARLENGELRLTADGRSLNVRYRGRYLPITSFGDGVVHVLLMAFEFMRKREHVFLIEEPETHLHPELIRMLAREISSDKNNNQFLITTHSPILLDAVMPQSTYCVEYNHDYSSVIKCNTAPKLRHVLDVLDARLSDLLQANCVIWVEGPSDRMFLNRCIGLLAPELQEGQHYLIAYYGGKVLSHFTASDERSDLLNVLRINRHSAFIADSDADDATSAPNNTKQRIKEEIEKDGGFFWMTEGREVENYIPSRVLTDVYKSLLPAIGEKVVSVGQFERLDAVVLALCENPARGDGWKVDYGGNKTQLMPMFCAAMKDTDMVMYDLDLRLRELLAFIKKSNSPVEAVSSKGPSPDAK